jgi:hypothetical protein
MAKQRRLNSDQLGHKGEGRFADFCNDAKLVCNKAFYDRNGWDYIVEFPFEPADRNTSLDKRAVPPSCHVQVKTMWSDKNAFSARLSSLERLAKEQKPSFIYVLKINDDLELDSAYLIPLIDDTLAMILCRLRQETAKGRLAVNHASMSLSVPDERAIALTGDALRSALLAGCGPDPEAVIFKKAQQFKTLGFEARPYQVETNFILEDGSEIADVLLGLKPVRFQYFKSSETRFGVTLPLDESNGGEMHIQPCPADRCNLVIRGFGSPLPASLSAEIFMPAALLKRSLTKYLIRSKLFEIEIVKDGARFATKPDIFDEAKLTLVEWINFYRMIKIFSAGPSTIDIVPTMLPRTTIEAEIKSFAGQKQSEKILEVLQSADTLFQLAGAEIMPMLLDDILAGAERHIAIAGLFSGAKDVQQLHFQATWPSGTPPEEMHALYIDAFKVADSKFAFSCVAKMAHETVEVNDKDIYQWRSREMRGHEIIAIRNFSEDYEKFAERTKSQTGIDMVIMATYDETGPIPG